MEKTMCACRDETCKIHKDRPCPSPSRMDGFKRDGPDVPLTPFCVPCAAHAVAGGEWRLRVRPGERLGN